MAPYYYYPAWFDGAPDISLMVNLKAWESLPKEYQAILELACAEAHIWMLAKYDAGNIGALRKMVAGGTKLQPFSREIMDAAYKATWETYDETASKNANFRKVYEPWKKFHGDSAQWFSVAENYYDNYIIAAQRQRK